VPEKLIERQRLCCQFSQRTAAVSGLIRRLFDDPGWLTKDRHSGKETRRTRPGQRRFRDRAEFSHARNRPGMAGETQVDCRCPGFPLVCGAYTRTQRLLWGPRRFRRKSAQDQPRFRRERSSEANSNLNSRQPGFKGRSLFRGRPRSSAAFFPRGAAGRTSMTMASLEGVRSSRAAAGRELFPAFSHIPHRRGVEPSCRKQLQRGSQNTKACSYAWVSLLWTGIAFFGQRVPRLI